MVHNNATPRLDVAAATYEVRAAGDLLTRDRATEPSLAQRYVLF